MLVKSFQGTLIDVVIVVDLLLALKIDLVDAFVVNVVEVVKAACFLSVH